MMRVYLFAVIVSTLLVYRINGFRPLPRSTNIISDLRRFILSPHVRSTRFYSTSGSTSFVDEAQEQQHKEHDESVKQEDQDTMQHQEEVESNENTEDEVEIVESEQQLESSHQQVNNSTEAITNTTSTNATTAEPSPLEIAIKNYEKKLDQELQSLESMLRSERLRLSKLREKISESGKSWYFIMQARINDFMKQKVEDQKKLMLKNRRDFIDKMIPVVDALQAVSLEHPATTDREKNIHDAYSSLLRSILIAFEKYGYTSFTPEEGTKLSPALHQIVGTEVAEESGLIIRTVKSGFQGKDGVIVRKAHVISTITDKVEESSSASKGTDAETTTDEDAATTTSVDGIEEIDEVVDDEDSVQENTSEVSENNSTLEENPTVE